MAPAIRAACLIGGQGTRQYGLSSILCFGGLSGVGEGTKGGRQGWVRGPWGVVRSMRGDHGGLMDPGW